jgi:hypothetical protein
MSNDGKETNLKLTNTPMVGGAKLSLVSMDQMTSEHIVVVVQLVYSNKLLGRLGKMDLPPNHICGMLAIYKIILTNRLFKKLPPRS